MYYLSHTQFEVCGASPQPAGIILGMSEHQVALAAEPSAPLANLSAILLLVGPLAFAVLGVIRSRVRVVRGGMAPDSAMPFCL
jgi:hypothetical protein